MRRFFKATPAQVYAAWTTPEIARRWWGCHGTETIALQMDLRVGGEWRWDVKSPEGETMTVVGRYVELTPGERVAFTWRWLDDPQWDGVESLVTVNLSPSPEGAEMLFTHTGLPSAASTENHREGWTDSAQRLEAELK